MRRLSALRDLPLSLFDDEAPVSTPISDPPDKGGSNPVDQVCRFLSVGESSGFGVRRLISGDRSYQDWLRVLVLRIIVLTSALEAFQNRHLSTALRVSEFLGFKNVERFAKDRSLGDLRSAFEFVLMNWETFLDEEPALPVTLQHNLEHLSQVIGLSFDERQVLGFLVLLNTESILKAVASLIRNSPSVTSVAEILADRLDLDSTRVLEMLQGRSPLSRSGLLSFSNRAEYEFPDHFDFVSDSLAQDMIGPRMRPHDVVREFLKPAVAASLTEKDFDHVRDRLDMITAYLAECFTRQARGVNILIYGAPGTGKTEFARLIAEHLGVGLLEISPASADGSPITPVRRLRGFTVAQAFFAKSRTLLCVDESEEIFGDAFGIEHDHSPVYARKSWINAALEANATPAIWIANSLREFDAAYIRRFDFSFEMPVPPVSVRQSMMVKVLDGNAESPMLREIAAHPQVTPALLSQVARVSKIGGLLNSPRKGESVFHRLINDKLKAQGHRPVQIRRADGVANLGFDPGLMNPNVDLQKLVSDLPPGADVRLCAYGPPGTGKTAFGQWLAKHLDKPHLVFHASDLLASLVGQTEKNIANAFQLALHEEAVLQFDEVDSLLRNRELLQQSWEVTMVNEMLVQMENFSGIFIASTNRFHGIDQAALRRFDVVVAFDFLKRDQALQLLLRLAEGVGLDVSAEEARHALGSFGELTPGDFQQAFRRLRLSRPNSIEELMGVLGSGVATRSGSQRIGFV